MKCFEKDSDGRWKGYIQTSAYHVGDLTFGRLQLAHNVIIILLQVTTTLLLMGEFQALFSASSFELW